MVEGAEREYLVYAPDEGNNLPVLLVLHGNPSTGWQMKTWTGMNEILDREDVVLVYPYAKDKRWPIDPQENKQEVAYFREMLADLQKEYSIDPSRIYMCGMSGGGIFSFQLVKEMPDTFAAFAVISGNMPSAYSAEDLPPTPFMYVHGTEDFLYPGREGLYSAEETLDLWKGINGVMAGNKESLPELNEKDGSSVLRLEYPGETPVLFYKVEGGGHHWPQAQFDANLFYSEPLGNFNKDLNTNQAIWEFVSQFSKSN